MLSVIFTLASLFLASPGSAIGLFPSDALHGPTLSNPGAGREARRFSVYTLDIA